MVLELLFFKSNDKVLTIENNRNKPYHFARLSLEYLVLWELHASVEFGYIHLQMDNAG